MPHFKLRPPLKPKLAENDVEKACLDFLRYRHYRPFRMQSGLFRTPDGRWIRSGEPGIPDWVIMHALFPSFLLETKRPKGELSVDQQKKLFELVELYKLAVCVADDVDVLRAWLPEHEKRARDAWFKHFEKQARDFHRKISTDDQNKQVTE